MSHYLVRCSGCKAIIEQCRCPGPKTERAGLCGGDSCLHDAAAPAPAPAPSHVCNEGICTACGRTVFRNGGASTGNAPAPAPSETCSRMCPADYTGHWRDWHGYDHNCKDPRFMVLPPAPDKSAGLAREEYRGIDSAVARLESMYADKGDTWDLSPNDRHAISTALREIAALRERLMRAEATVQDHNVLCERNDKAVRARWFEEKARADKAEADAQAFNIEAQGRVQTIIALRAEVERLTDSLALKRGDCIDFANDAEAQKARADKLEKALREIHRHDGTLICDVRCRIAAAADKEAEK